MFAFHLIVTLQSDVVRWLLDLENNPASAFEEPREDVPTASKFTSTINLTNNIIGTVILAMPFSYSKFGLGFGAVMELFLMSASIAGVYFLISCAQILGGRSTNYANLSKLTYPRLALAFELIIAIKCFGIGVSYFMVMGDLLPQIGLYFSASEDSVWCSRSFWIVVGMVLIFPLALIGSLDSLSYISYVALLSIGLLVYIIVVGFYKWANFGFFAGFPVFVFGFSCHENILSIYNELKDNRPGGISLVVACAFITSALVYMAIGAFGYLTYGSNVSANILAMYDIGPLLTIGRIAVVVLAAFSYPFQCQPCRAILIKLMTDDQTQIPNSTAISQHTPDHPQPNCPNSHFEGVTPFNARHLYIPLTTIILFGNGSIALLVKRLDHVLALVGSVGSTCITLIFPALLFLALDRLLSQRDGAYASPHPYQRLAAYGLTTLVGFHSYYAFPTTFTICSDEPSQAF
ncbi:hypothetical protein L0F63_000374 [Massospora cicadina]|nr:hypothetical protein L0F63_000374 [Massospora cicadina]